MTEETLEKRAAEEAKEIEETIEKLKKAGFVECGPRELTLNTRELALNINEYDHRGIPVRLTKEEFEIIKLPKLNEDERKYYDEIKQAENGDKIKMVGDVIYDYEYDDDHCFTPEEVYRTIEAIVKGGYNQ